MLAPMLILTAVFHASPIAVSRSLFEENLRIVSSFDLINDHKYSYPTVNKALPGIAQKHLNVAILLRLMPMFTGKAQLLAANQCVHEHCQGGSRNLSAPFWITPSVNDASRHQVDILVLEEESDVDPA
jgi:hypothetical protein